MALGTAPGLWEQGICWVAPSSEYCRSMQQERMEIDQQRMQIAQQQQAEMLEQARLMALRIAPWAVLVVGGAGLFLWYRAAQRQHEEELYYLERSLTDA